MHIITWTNKMDSFGHIYDEKDSKYWYTQTYVSPYIKQAAYRLKKLRELEAKGCITNIKHIFEE
jgi:hypothetical protein